MKTKITLVLALFILSFTKTNAQKITPEKVRIDQYNSKPITTGFQGLVSLDDNSNKKRKGIPRVEIVFKSEDGTRTQKVTTSSSGRYKIGLKPGRYSVSIKHRGYKIYAPSGFGVITKKIQTYNFHLKKLVPTRR